MTQKITNFEGCSRWSKAAIAEQRSVKIVLGQLVMSDQQSNLPEWVRTDEWADFCSSLEHLGSSLANVSENPQEWKWAIIACHSAVQGALVCVLSGSAGIGCLDNASITRVSEWIERSRSNPDLEAPLERLADFMSLVERAYDPNYMNEFGGAPMPLDQAQMDDLRSLHELRNQFIHFRPQSWSIEITGLPRIMRVGVTFSQRIMLGHPACTYRLRQEQLEILMDRFATLSARLEALGCEPLPELIREPEHLIRRD